MNGARKWFFPDGYIPSGRRGDLVSHESLCVLNAGEKEAHLTIKIFFENRDPIVFERTLKPQRDVHIRLEGIVPKETPYGVVLESDVPVVAQLSRLDVGPDHHTLMTSIGYWED